MPDLCVDVIGNVTSCHDAETFGLIVFVLASVFCFQYHFYYLLFEVQAVQDVIHLPDESRTCIQSSTKIYMRNLLDHLDNL